jgi:hypothetical protein
MIPMRKKTEISPVDKDAAKWIKEDAGFAADYFEALAERPLPVQLATLRRLCGITQDKMAARLHVRQAYVSKLEKLGSDHLVSNYEKAARFLHGRLAIIPEGGKIVHA